MAPALKLRSCDVELTITSTWKLIESYKIKENHSFHSLEPFSKKGINDIN